MVIAMASVGLRGKVGTFLPRLCNGSADGEILGHAHHHELERVVERESYGDVFLTRRRSARSTVGGLKGRR